MLGEPRFVSGRDFVCESFGCDGGSVNSTIIINYQS